MNPDYWLIQNLPLPLAIFNIKWRLENASSPFFELFPDAKLQLLFQEIFPDRANWQKAFAQVYQNQVRYRVQEDNLDFYPIFDHNHDLQGIAVFFHDFVKQLVAEAPSSGEDNHEKLQQTVMGLAHEIRNPLAGIKGAAQLIQKNTTNIDNVQEYCEILIRETERLDRLVGTLARPYSSQNNLKRQTLNIHEPLRAAARSVQLATQKKIEIHEEFDLSLPAIAADADALEQIFLNLIKNAEEAIEHGTIRLKTSTVTDFQLKIGDTSKRHLNVQIIDNGPGLSESETQRIFTPYYSTKAQGLGLGLTVTHHLVEQLGGHLQVKSQIGKGTTFSVILPHL